MVNPNSPLDQGQIEPIREMARSFWYSAILRAAIKLNVFSILDGNVYTAEGLAKELSADPGFVGAFLEACQVTGLLERSDGVYSNTATTSRFLVQGREQYVGDHALHHTNAWASWGRLDELILEGKTLLPFESGFVDQNTYWTNYMLGQHNRAMSGQAYHLVEKLNLEGMTKLIDLGGGAASYSMALCEANPQLTSVVVDGPEPIAIARSFVAERGLGDRIRLIAGDFFKEELGSDYDVVLVSGVVLIKSEQECRRLFELAYNLLKPKGMVVIQDFMRIGRTQEQAKADVLENLYVKVAFDPRASDREGTEVASWLKDTGFQDTQQIPIPAQLALITAHKPAIS